MGWATAAAWAVWATAAAAQDSDVPFVTTPDPVVHAMLDIAKVTTQDHVIDLGSGDGRIVIAAAIRHRATALGVEIDEALVTQAQQRAQRAGVADRTEFRVQDLFMTDLARATVVTMYLLPEVNLQLRPKLLKLAPGTRIVSHDWDMGDWPPDAEVTIPVPEKTLGRAKFSRVFLWVVPARIEGRWCDGQGQLTIEQRFQHVRILVPGKRAVMATLHGHRLKEQGRDIGGTQEQGVLTVAARSYRRCI